MKEGIKDFPPHPHILECGEEVERAGRSSVGGGKVGRGGGGEVEEVGGEREGGKGGGGGAPSSSSSSSGSCSCSGSWEPGDGLRDPMSVTTERRVNITVKRVLAKGIRY